MRVILSLMLTLALAWPVSAQQDKIRSVISGQIAAFLADDFASALTFAAPGIKQVIQTPSRFKVMVTKGYPMVYRPADFQFKELHQNGETVVQDVLFRDGDGDYFDAEYQLIQTENGWKISGVKVVKAAGLGA